MEEYYDGVVAKPDLDELYHYGILGMHWGRRNGPPYPLGSDVSTGHRLKSGAAGSISKTKKKLAKASAKAAKANKKAAKASNSLLHPVMNYHKNAYQSKAFKTQAKVDKLQKKLVKEENKEQNRRAKEYLDKYSNEVVDYGEDGKMTRKEWIKLSEDTVNNIDKRNPGFKKWLDDTYPDRSEHPVTEYDKYEQEYEEAKKLSNADFDGGESYLASPKAAKDREIEKETGLYKNKEGTIKPTDAMAKELKRLGISFEDAFDASGQPTKKYEDAFRNKKITEVANSNQDMFNDILDRTSNGPSMKKNGQNWRTPEIASADKEFSKLVKQVAKEAGVDRGDLESKILESYEKRNSEIAKNDAARQEQKQAQEHRESINRRLQNAKTRDQWDLGFLEAVQNESWAGNDFDGEGYNQTKMLQEYKKYLEDPEKYWKNR